MKPETTDGLEKRAQKLNQTIGKNTMFKIVFILFVAFLAIGMFIPLLGNEVRNLSADSTAKSEHSHSITICADFDKQEKKKSLLISLMTPFSAGSFHKLLDDWKLLGNSYCQRIENVFVQGYTTEFKTHHPRLESITIWYYKPTSTKATNQVKSINIKSRNGHFIFRTLPLPENQEYEVFSIAPNTPTSPPLVPN
jgi:hypothetical protein